MERRAFLALLASAPIAALAPWPKFLPAPRLAFRADAFALAMAPLHDRIMREVIADMRADVIEGVGYFRSEVTPTGELGISRRVIAAYDPEQDRHPVPFDLHDTAMQLALSDDRDIPYGEKLADALTFLKSRIQ